MIIYVGPHNIFIQVDTRTYFSVENYQILSDCNAGRTLEQSNIAFLHVTLCDIDTQKQKLRTKIGEQYIFITTWSNRELRDCHNKD